MSLLPILNDSNIIRFTAPVVIGVNAILCCWAVNQLSVLRTIHQRWRLLKLAIEVGTFAILLDYWATAIKGISSIDSVVQGVGLAYFVLLMVVLGAIVDDTQQLIRRSLLNVGSEVRAELLPIHSIRWHHQRQALIRQVRIQWVRGVLEKSFSRTARIELALEEHQQLALSGTHSNQVAERRRLPQGRRIFDEFTELGEGGTLLILGEPGAGKTTQLLELVRDLLDFTDAADPNQAVPVVLSLASWGSVQSFGQPVKTLHEWLVEELSVQYRLKRPIIATWLNEEKLTLLLDGLDAIPAALRDECIAAINQFQCDHGKTAIVVCSRTADYETFQARFDQFRKVLSVLPLEPQQVEEYLEEAGQSLEGVKVALERDPELRSLARKPLFLSVLSLAYRGISADELVNRSNSERLRRLFDRYLERMSTSYPMSQKNQQETGYFLSILAAQMGAGRSIFIDRMPPIEWLQKRQLQRRYRLMGGILGGMLVGSIIGLIVGLLFGLVFGLLFGLIFALEK